MAVALSERGVETRIPPENGRKPLHYEGLANAELFWLFTSLVWHGIGVPRGDGSPVITIPGFIDSDWHLMPLNSWLSRMNYRSYFSDIVINTDPESHIEEVAEKAKRIYEREGRKIHLIGHSLGGVIARGVGHEYPEYIESVTALGSPIDGDFEEAVNPFVLALGKVIIPSFRNPEEFARRKEQLLQLLPQGVRSTYIYTKSDGVVDWHACIDPDPRATSIKVSGTHTGLVWNPQVYEHIAHILASAPEKLYTSLSSLGFTA